MKEILIKEYASTSKLSLPFKEPITKVTLDFTDGPKCTINNGGSQSYQVKFINPNTGLTIYESTIQNNMWTQANVKYFVPWNVKVIDLSNNKLILNYNFNLKNKKIHISFGSKAIGDTIAWLPYVEEFREKHNCEIICSTFHNKWFESKYPKIKFSKPGSSHFNIYATYNIGWFHSPNKNPNNTLTIPLQQTASDILGLPFKEIKPKTSFKISKPNIKGPYVTLSLQSTSQAKYWNYIGGWQQVVNFLNSKGYKVVCIDKYSVFGSGKCMNATPKNTINKTGCSFDEAASLIKGANFHLGISSGLSWLSWALGTHVVMVSSFSNPLCEFKSGCTRIYNDTELSGYYNNPSFKFDPGNWHWNPFLDISTPEEWHDFEPITPEQVINEIKQIL